MNKLLVDSSFLFALFSVDDADHHRAREVIRRNAAQPVFPDVVLTEVAFLMNRAGGTPAVSAFLKTFAASQPMLQPVELIDLTRAAAIMDDYPRSRLDFVECCIMALSERLNVTQVATFDRRDFSIFRPRHCDYLDLLP